MTLEGFETVLAFDYAPQKQFLLVATTERTMLIDMKAGKVLNKYGSLGYAPADKPMVWLNPNGAMAACTAGRIMDGIHFIDVTNGDILYTLGSAPVEQLWFANSGKEVLVLTAQRLTRYEIATGKELQRVQREKVVKGYATVDSVRKYALLDGRVINLKTGEENRRTQDYHAAVQDAAFVSKPTGLPASKMNFGSLIAAESGFKSLR
jgi:hypothetical protein